MHALVVAAVLSVASAAAGVKIAAIDPLAAARAAFAAGRFDEAHTLATAAGVDAPGLAGAALEQLGDEKAACALYEKDRGSSRGPAATLRAGRCRAAAHDVPGALAAYSEVAASPLGKDPLVVDEIAAFIDAHDLPAAGIGGAVDLPVGLFDDARREALGRALFVLVARGDKAQSARALERLLVELPDTAAGKKATALPAAQHRPPEDLAAAVKRADALAARHASDDVIALLSPLVKQKDTSAPACEARLLMGKAYRKLRKYHAAKKELDDVAARCSDDVKERAAYLAARVAWVTHSASAPALLAAFVKSWPDDRLTDDVLMWTGDLAEDAGDHKAAEAAWSRIVKSFPGGDMVHEARFRIAWSRAAAGDVEGARAALDDAARLAPHGGQLLIADRALYWRARLGLAPRLDSLEVTGDDTKRDAALSALAALASSRPASWYGELARLLVKDVEAGVARGGAPKVASAKGAPSAPAATPTHVREAALSPGASLTASKALAADPRFVLARALVAGGYDAEALLVLGAIADVDIGAGPGSAAAARLVPEDRFVLALYLSEAGDPGAGHALLRDGGLALLPGSPSTETALAWSLDWPLAHAAAVDAAADAHKVPRPLLFGLAREESAFDADVVSWAGAVGLCQLMMPTAGDEAKSEKLPKPTVDDLKDPVLNARLAASHLARRLRMMKHPALAIAAYNAGPGAVRKWNPKGPLDAWVERIPVDETRNYVKKVTGSWVTYAILDGSVDDVSFPLVLR